MIWIDFSIIGLLSVTLTVGLLKGFSQQAFSLLTWTIAILVGIYFSRDFALFLKTAINDPVGRIAAAFVALCLITQVFSSLIGMLLGSILKKPALSLVDRLGGMLFGLAHGSLFVTAIILLAGLSVLPKAHWWQESKLIPPFQSVAVWICDNIRSELTQNVHYN